MFYIICEAVKDIAFPTFFLTQAITLMSPYDEDVSLHRKNVVITKLKVSIVLLKSREKIFRLNYVYQ